MFLVIIYGLLKQTNSLDDFEESSYYLYNFPITCPYEITEEAGINPGVLGSGEIDLSQVSSNFYQQYKAALALVPCDATALRVFTTDEIEGKKFTIGIIFVYDSSVEAIKMWLE